MEVIRSRVVVHPVDFTAAVDACSLFGLHTTRVYGPLEDPAGVVFALGGGGELEISRQPGVPPSGVTFWVQVPDSKAAALELQGRGFKVEVPVLRPWGLLECPVDLFDGVGVILVEVPREHPLHWRG